MHRINIFVRKHYSPLLAALMLAIFGFTLITSSWNDSTIVDEISHIGSGYSYLTQQDMRANPEHPPLIKDIAALPLLVLDISFSTMLPAWRFEHNPQWSIGEHLLYLDGNNGELIIRLARVPMMMLAVALGAILFLWIRKAFDEKTALLTLFFYVSSPTIIAHSRYVTTDIGATLGFVLGIIAFLWFLKTPDWKHMTVFGVVLSMAELLKFSLVLLVPIYCILVLLWWFTGGSKDIKTLVLFYLKLVCAGLIAAMVIWLVYLFHIWNYPLGQALTDVHAQLSEYRRQWLVDIVYQLMQHWVTRPWGQYLFGVVLVMQRSTELNTAYFLGELGKAVRPSYFPIMYVYKETLGFHVLSFIALCTWAWRNFRTMKLPKIVKIQQWVQTHFIEITCVVVIIVYWIVSVRGTLNIGIRHVLPTFPFIYILVARGLGMWLERTWKWVLFFCVAAWMLTSVALTFPYYISYYNELAGGTWNGYAIAADSNYDWGQDLKRLGTYIQSHPSDDYYVDYFGASTLQFGPQNYWLGDTFQVWHSKNGAPPSGSVFAVSIGYYINSRATLLHGFDDYKEADLYPWLAGKEPFERIGTSILLFRMP